MATRQEIVDAIVGGSWTRDDVEAFYDAAKTAWDMTGQRKKAQFKVGDRVTFEFRGERQAGKVIKLLQKNIRVWSDDGFNIRLSPSLVSKVIAEKTIQTPAGPVQMTSLSPNDYASEE